METKELNKKLVLNKKILAHLENAEMKVSKAGGNPWLENPTTPVQLCQ
jgi:hypothetical protein